MKSRYEIPVDIYDYVHETILAIVNAAEAGDDVLRVSNCERLRYFCEQQTAAGRGSGFMWEAFGDVTEDADQRVSCYERALKLAEKNGEPAHTVLLALGDLHLERGDWDQARYFLDAALRQAISSEDPETQGEAALLLRKIHRNGVRSERS